MNFCNPNTLFSFVIEQAKNYDKIKASGIKYFSLTTMNTEFYNIHQTYPDSQIMISNELPYKPITIFSFIRTTS